MSDDILRRSINDICVKFEIRAIKHNTSDKINKSKDGIKDRI